MRAEILGDGVCIHAVSLRQPLGDVLQRLGAAGCEDKIVAIDGEAFGEVGADAGGGACDEGGLTGPRFTLRHLAPPILGATIGACGSGSKAHGAPC